MADRHFARIIALGLLLSLASQGIAQNGKYDPTTLVFPTFMHTYGVRKATKFHLFLYVQNRVKVRNPQGIAATRLRSWEDPNTTKDDDELTVYGVNSGENVVIYNSSMSSIGIYGLNERGEKQLNRPHGITAAPWGDVYVADTGNNRVVHLFNPRRKLTFVRALSLDGMIEPTDVALTEDSTLYVADTGRSRLLVVRGDSLHAVLADSGSAVGQVFHPTALAAISANDAWSRGELEFVVVVDMDGKRIQRFSRTGAPEAVVIAADFGYPDVWLQYAAIDYFGQVWVTDRRNHCIHKFDSNLRYLDSFGRKGSGKKEFVEPRGISIYRRFGQVLIAEKAAAQYYWIGTDVKNLRVVRDEQGFLQVGYFLTEPSFVTLELFDRSGKKLATLMQKMRRPAGENEERFTGNWQALPYRVENDTRHYTVPASAEWPAIASGQYRLRMTLSATYSSYKYFEKKVDLEVEF